MNEEVVGEERWKVGRKSKLHAISARLIHLYYIYMANINKMKSLLKQVGLQKRI